jgi:hypothetical protein
LDLVEHYGQSDQVINPGEGRLALLLLCFALPAGLLVARALEFTPNALIQKLKRLEQSRIGYWLPAAFAAFAALAAWAIAHCVHDYAWFTDDEQAYLYQAKLYLEGQLTGPVIEPSYAFRHHFVVPVSIGNEVRWSGVYPVLQPFLISLSMRVGFSHLSQLVAVFLVVYHSARFAETWLNSRRSGWVVAFLGATSPILLGLGSTLHTSVLATALSVMAARLLLWTVSSGKLKAGMFLGLCAGSVVLARPMEGTLVVSMTGLILGCWAWRSASHPLGIRVRTIVGFALGGLVPFTVFLLVNRGTSGQWLSGAYAILETEIGRFFGFGTRMMWGRTHSPAIGFRQTLTALLRLNNWLFAWPVCVLVPLCALLRPLRDRRLVLLLLVSAIQLSAYFFLAFGSVHDFGSAYHVWHLPWLATVTAWVVVRGSAWLGARFPRRERFALFAPMAFVLVGLATFWPIQIQRWHQTGHLIREPVREAARVTGGRPAIVLWSQIQPQGSRYLSWVFRPPSPHLSDRVLWAYQSPGLTEALRRRFPERELFSLTWKGTKPMVSRIEL